MDTLRYKTISANRTTVKRNWVLVNAEGKILGRLASRVAYVLRGKHKTDFTPHVDCGDNVIIINADKIRMTGKKWSEKEIISHTGYPGGQKIQTPKEIHEHNSTKLLEEAVRGMLSKSNLGKKIFSGRLHIFAGTTHPYESKNPQSINL